MHITEKNLMQLESTLFSAMTTNRHQTKHQKAIQLLIFTSLLYLKDQIQCFILFSVTISSSVNFIGFLLKAKTETGPVSEYIGTFNSPPARTRRACTYVSTLITCIQKWTVLYRVFIRTETLCFLKMHCIKIANL